MAAKSALTVIGLVMIAQGILFYVFKEVITLDMFPGVNKEALRVGEIMRELLAAGSLFIGVILLLSSNCQLKVLPKLEFVKTARI